MERTKEEIWKECQVKYGWVDPALYEAMEIYAEQFKPVKLHESTDARVIVEKIFYSPATNGKAEQSIKEGIALVEALCKKAAWEGWNACSDQINIKWESEALKERFETWYKNRKA